MSGDRIDPIFLNDTMPFFRIMRYLLIFVQPAYYSGNLQKTGFDPFEPQLIHHAFRCTAVNFGPLIFGQELWKKLSDAEELPTLFQNINPLSKFFSNINGICLFVLHVRFIQHHNVFSQEIGS